LRPFSSLHLLVLKALGTLGSLDLLALKALGAFSSLDLLALDVLPTLNALRTLRFLLFAARLHGAIAVLSAAFGNGRSGQGQRRDAGDQ
jgi:hypothetical protein